MTVSCIAGEPFQLLLVEQLHSNDTKLHIYIEGDGIPWIEQRYISEDPTPLRPLALGLMSRDPNNAIYLGRPCYYLSKIPTKSGQLCQPNYWTFARYGKTVLNSMANAVKNYLRGKNFREITFIGYSGGGVIATLLADFFHRQQPYGDKLTVRLVTVAANLDTQRWSKFHRYSELKGSINPATSALSPETKGFHFYGTKDTNVPASLNQGFFERQGVSPIIVPHFNHTCCWVGRWTSLLESIKP